MAEGSGLEPRRTLKVPKVRILHAPPPWTGSSVAERVAVNHVDVGSIPTQFANRDPGQENPGVPRPVTLAEKRGTGLWPRADGSITRASPQRADS